MADLSPAAKAVLDAYKDAPDVKYVNGEWIQDEAGQVAAALRAVADQVAPEGFAYDSGSLADGALEFEQGQDCRNEVIRSGLLAIAAELEGAQ